MNKQEWIEYFEAINRRLPNQEEMEAALANGEFTEEATEVVAEVVEPEVAVEQVVLEMSTEGAIQVAPTSETAQVSQEAPVASQVEETPVQPSQSVVSPVAPTQTTQGQATQQQQYQMPPQPQQPGKFQIMVNDFWVWFVSALKKPSTLSDTRPTNGYIVFGLLSFFYALTFFLLARGLAQPVRDYFDFIGETHYNPVGFQAFLIFCIVSSLLVFSIIIAGFIVKRVILGASSFTLLQSFEWYGRHFALSLILVIVACLFAFLGIGKLTLYLLWTSLMLLGVVSTFNIARSLNESNMDTFYRYLLAIVVNSVIIAIFAYIELSLIANYASASYF